MTRLDETAIATRIRELLRNGTAFDAAAAAQRLHVEETALRISTDDISPYPSMDVLAAVVEYCGVDPHWLLTGAYSSTSHYGSIQTPRDQIVQTLVKIVTGISPSRLETQSQKTQE